MGLSTKPEALKCPRCESTNTKFCYYNNYNKTQPRHFCKGCKRYWTEGGILRNVPFGGGRKNKRFKTSTSTSSSTIIVEKSSSQLVVQNKQNIHNFDPLGSSNIDEEKNISGNIFYQELCFSSSSLPYDTIGNVSRKGIMGNNSMFTSHDVPQDERMLVSSFSSSNRSFEKNIPSSIPISTQSSNVSNYMEEATITSLVCQPMEGPESSTVMDNNMPNYWNWTDIDALVSADDLNIPWSDDTQIKP